MNKKISKHLNKRKLSNIDEEEEEDEENDNQYEEDSFIVNDQDVEENEEEKEESEDSEAALEGLDEESLDVLEESKEEKTKHQKKRLVKKGGDNKDKSEEAFYDIINEHENDKENEDLIKKGEDENEKQEQDQEESYNQDDNKRTDKRKRNDRRKKPRFNRDEEQGSINMENENIENAEFEPEVSSLDKLIKIKKIYNNEEIEDHYCTERDNLIKALDFPERILRNFSENDLRLLSKQIKEEQQATLLTLKEEDIISEVNFIYERIKQRVGSHNDSDFSEKIKSKLNAIISLMKIKHYEIPFIINYRKDCYEPELRFEMWNIFNLDVEWQRFSKYKKSLKSQLKQIKLLNIDNLEFIENKSLEKARNNQELKYVENYIKYNKDIYSEELERLKELSIKQESMKTSALLDSENIGNENTYQSNTVLNLKEEVNEYVKTELDEIPKVLGCLDEKGNSNSMHLRPIKQRLIPNKSRKNAIMLGRKFGLSPYNFTANIELLNRQCHDMTKFTYHPDPLEDPVALSEGYLDDYFKNNQELVRSTADFLAEEIQVYPPFKHYIFHELKSLAKLSTYPTQQGLKELEIFHPSFRVKRLKNKPILSFDNELYMEIHRCEKEGLITFTIDIDNEDIKVLTKKLNKCYSNENCKHDTGRRWNIIRDEVIKVLINSVVSNFKKDILVYLRELAEAFIIDQSSMSFRELLMTGPFKKSKGNIKEGVYFEDCPKTLSLVYDHDNGAVFSVMLDEFGEVKEIQSFNFLVNRLENQPRNDFNNKENPRGFGFFQNNEFYNETNGESEYSKVKSLLAKFSPELIVVGANNIRCKQIKENIAQIARESIIDQPIPEVVFGNTSIPYIFATSHLLESKYLPFNLPTRMAISLGRLKQNPMAEVLQLWHEDINSNRCVLLQLHPLQKSCNQTRLIERLETEAIRIVNNVGVDINRIKEHSHLEKQLWFISGLGPRKASYLIEKVTQFGEFKNRQDFSAVLKERIVANISGFIRIRNYSFIKKSRNADYSQNNNMITSADLNEHAKLLDLTRIHPESYAIANLIILGIFNNDKKVENSRIEEIFNNPPLVEELDIDDYIQKNNIAASNRFTYDLITSELKNPFKDPRKDHKMISEMELFKLMTADNPTEEGHIVLAKSQKVGKSQVFCKLDNDLEAVLWKNDIFEDGGQHNDDVEERMNQMYPKGSLFYARVKAINKTTFKVDLVTKPSQMINHQKEDLKNLDEFFIVDPEEDLKNTLVNTESNQVKQKQYHKRNINHPNFKNFNYMQCLEYLRNKEIGEFVFRPSSKSNDCLTLSWKFYDDIVSHIVIAEEDKAKGANIGSKLRISNDTYSSLHEIAYRFVNPCKRIVLDSINNRKFTYFDTVEELEARLKIDKQKDALLIHYIFTINRAYPQYIILAYIPKMNQVIKEFMKVKPRGLFFHNNYFMDLNDVAKYFKENYSKEEYRSYVRKIKPPGEENLIESSNNFGSSNFIQNSNNINSLRNDYNSASYLGSKRNKSPNAYNNILSNNGANNFGSYSNINEIKPSIRKNERNTPKQSDNNNNNNINSNNWGSKIQKNYQDNDEWTKKIKKFDKCKRR